MQLQNKHLRWHYTVAASLLGIFIIGFLLFSKQERLTLETQTLEILKSIAYLLTLVGIPFAYGWFQKYLKVKKVEEKVDGEEETEVPQAEVEKGWLNRFYIFSALSFINMILFVLTFDNSLMFLLIISLSVFLLNKPKVQR